MQMRYLKYSLVLCIILLFSAINYAQAPVTPNDGQAGVSQSLGSVSWTAFDEGGVPNGPYDVDFDDDPLFGSVDASATSTAATSLSLPALSYNTEYHWRVRDTDINGSGGDGGWHVYSFKTQIDPSSITINSQPPNAPNLAVTGQSIDFSYTHSGTASTVTIVVQINDGSGWTTLATFANQNSNLINQVVNLTPLDYNTNYDTRIVVTNDDEGTDNFTVNGNQFKTGFPTIGLDSPADGAELSDRTPTLQWSASASVSNVTYNLNVTGPNAYSYNNTETSPFTFGANLDFGTYTWEVTIDDSNTPLDNTAVTTASRTFKVVPGLISPANTLTGVSLEPEFSWDYDGTSTYLIEIATDNLFANVVASKSVAAGSYNFTESDAGMPLDNNTTYYWRVTVNGAVSSVWSFTTLSDFTVTQSFPSDAMEVIQYDPLLFSWYLGIPVGSMKFSLQVYEKSTPPTQSEWYNAVNNYVTTSSTADFAYFIDNINTLNQSAAGLQGSSKYYWRVVAYYDDGTVANKFDFSDRVAKYSSVFSFTTKGGAVKAYPSWPIGNATVYTLQPTLYWYTVESEPNATYTVLISKTNSGADPAKLDDETAYSSYSSGANLFYTLTSNLDANTHYYWQVKTTYNSQTNYSDIAEFTTYAAATVTAYQPVPSYPIGGVDVYTTSPTLYWYVAGLATDLRYDIEINTTNTFTGTPTYTNISNLYYQVTNLTAGATYYWKVRSYENGNPANASAWSSAESFKIVGGQNSSAVASYPVGNPTVYTARPTLSWYIDGSTLGWSGFIVRWKETSASADWANTYDGTVTINDINTLFYTFTSDLTYGSTYYWAVALYDGTNAPAHADYSQGSFTVVGGGTVTVVPSAPNNASLVYDDDVTLYWYLNGSNLGITGFEVQYSQQSNFGSPTTIAPGTVGNNYSYQLTGLTPGATYYWRVRGYYSGANYTPYSTIYSFTIDPGASSVVPMVGSPNGGVVVNTAQPMLSWFVPAPSKSTLKYDVELADNPEFSDLRSFENLEQLHAAVESLAPGEYYWRVRSKTSNGDVSEYSESGYFKVGDNVTGVEEAAEIPSDFALEQNYPNPFNPETVIKFSLPESRFISLKIYNILGQEVRTLINREFQAGNHTIVWNGKDNYGKSAAAGVYFYRIDAGEFTAVKKMILMK